MKNKEKLEKLKEWKDEKIVQLEGTSKKAVVISKKAAKLAKKLKSEFVVFLESLQTNGRALIVFTIGLILLMGIITAGIFLIAVKGSEEVMVPDVVGKELTQALLDMQIKELYPKIQLRYSNSPDEKGCVLEQNPGAGAIVKAGRRIELVVSQGVVLDSVEDYVGQTVDDVRLHLQAIFASSGEAQIVLDEKVLYENNDAEAGTILAQDPAPGTAITEPVLLKLVASKGPSLEKATVPNLVGLTVDEVLSQIKDSKLVFDFSSVAAQTDEEAGKIVSQDSPADTSVDSYSRVGVVVAFPENKEGRLVYGIFESELPEYPYALQISLDALTPTGERINVVQMRHPGGKITVPYALPSRSELILSIYDKEFSRELVK